MREWEEHKEIEAANAIQASLREPNFESERQDRVMLERFTQQFDKEEDGSKIQE